MSTNVIPSDSPSVFDTLSTLQTASPDQYAAIVRPNNPPAGIGGFLFDIPGDEEIRMKSAITRHYVENNTPISDHIALEPEIITLRGVIAELTTALQVSSSSNPPPQVLPVCAPMVPQLTAGSASALVSDSTMTPAAGPALAQSAAARTSLPPATVTQDLLTASSGTPSQGSSAAGGVSALCASSGDVGLLTASSQLSSDISAANAQPDQSVYSYYGANAPKTTRQITAFQFFQQAWWGRQLMSVETPWGMYLNLAISEVRAVQTKETKGQSEFTVAFEKIRVVGDLRVSPGVVTGRNVAGSADTVQQNAGHTGPTAAESARMYSAMHP